MQGENRCARDMPNGGGGGGEGGGPVVKHNKTKKFSKLFLVGSDYIIES